MLNTETLHRNINAYSRAYDALYQHFTNKAVSSNFTGRKMCFILTSNEKNIIDKETIEISLNNGQIAKIRVLSHFGLEVSSPSIDAINAIKIIKKACS